MQSLYIEIVIAVLFLFLLSSLARGRADTRLRLWAGGWLLVTLHLTCLLYRSPVPLMQSTRETIFLGSEVLAGSCFLLSDPSIIRGRKLFNRSGLLCLISTAFVLAFVFFRFFDRGVLCVYIVAGHIVAIELPRKYAQISRSMFFSLAALHFLFAVFMLTALMWGHPEFALAALPAELFAGSAILFTRNYSLRDPANVMAVIGLALWSVACFVEAAVRYVPVHSLFVSWLLEIPSFLVAVGLVMIVLEEDASVARRLVQEYELLYTNSPVPLWIYDTKTLRFLSVNPASAKAHGYSVEEFRRKKITDVVHPEMHKVILSDLMQPKAVAHRQALHVRKDGTTLPMKVTAYDIQFRGRPARMALGEDISEKEELASKLLHQVRHDFLTGLPNRTMFLQKLDAISEHARSNSTECAVLVVHINRFEKINEMFGHAFGDRFLKALTRRLQSRLRPGDAVGRTGSREFTIAFPYSSDGQAIESRARDLLRNLNEPLLVDQQQIEPSLSMGLAVFPEDSDDPLALLRDAVRALGHTQARGAANFVRLSRQMSTDAQEQSRIETLLHHALLNGGFEVFYQPIFNSKKAICATEALLRLKDNDGSHISPTIFIPIAEASGAILSIGLWVIGAVCAQLMDWKRMGLQAHPVAINVSALQIVQPSFYDEVMEILRGHGVEPTLIHLELTETSAMPQSEMALENMSKLAAEGVSFSIDDFGTGFSSLNRLHQLPVALLKVDRSFVDGMMKPGSSLPIINTIVSMAHSLNVGVIAEGVETKQQFHALYEIGCDQFQGYYFARPVNTAAMTQLLSPIESVTMLEQTHRRDEPNVLPIFISPATP